MSKRDQTAATRIKMLQSRIKMYQGRLEKQAERIVELQTSRKGMRRKYMQKYQDMCEVFRAKGRERINAHLAYWKRRYTAWKWKFIHKHHAKLEKKDHEIWKRGEVIEELNIHLTCFRNVVPSDYFNACRNTLDKYIGENTISEYKTHKKYARSKK